MRLSSSRSIFFFETGSPIESESHSFSETSCPGGPQGRICLSRCSTEDRHNGSFIFYQLSHHLAWIFLTVLYPRKALNQGPPFHHGPVNVLSEFSFVIRKNRGSALGREVWSLRVVALELEAESCQ